MAKNPNQLADELLANGTFTSKKEARKMVKGLSDETKKNLSKSAKRQAQRNLLED